jgi:tetratricopeptide (TPR) repeat protein
LKRVIRTLWLVLPVALGCAAAPPVTRMVGGHVVEGRFVADGAYAAYLRGVVLETQGQLEAAMAAYGEAIEHDPESAELWTRMGVVRCAAGVTPGAAAKAVGPWDAFARAERIDPTYEETWTERARCHLNRGELDDAARAARAAVSLDPDRRETAILLALVLERQGHLEEARRWLNGLIARDASSIEAHEAMAAFAVRTGDEGRRLGSEEALALLRPPLSGAGVLRRGEAVSLSGIDAAIGRGDFDRARRLALAARLSSGALALRAAALGSVSFARIEAELVLAADPADGDARVAATVAADLARDDAAFSRALSGVPANDAPLSPLATLLMAELLSRRVGADARRAWLHGVGPLANSNDPLVSAVANRH